MRRTAPIVTPAIPTLASLAALAAPAIPTLAALVASVSSRSRFRHLHARLLPNLLGAELVLPYRKLPGRLLAHLRVLLQRRRHVHERVRLRGARLDGAYAEAASRAAVGAARRARRPERVQRHVQHAERGPRARRVSAHEHLAVDLLRRRRFTQRCDVGQLLLRRAEHDCSLLARHRAQHAHDAHDGDHQGLRPVRPRLLGVHRERLSDVRRDRIDDDAAEGGADRPPSQLGLQRQHSRDGHYRLPLLPVYYARLGRGRVYQRRLHRPRIQSRPDLVLDVPHRLGERHRLGAGLVRECFHRNNIRLWH